MVAQIGSAVAAAFVLGSLLQPTSFPASVYLTHDDIVEAIEAGTDETVAPYRLLQEIGNPPTPKTAIYTPFVRVALAARAAKGRGEEQDVSRLPRWVTAPVVLVVFAAPCVADCRYGDQQYDLSTPLGDVGVGPLLGMPGTPLQAPWARALEIKDDLSFLDEIGGLPFDDARVAGVFDARSLSPGLTLFARWILPDRSRPYSGGIISEDDLLRWR